MSLIVIWAALVRRAVWAFWSLATALLFLEVVRWLGESFFYQENLLGDAATLLPTLAGITCAAIGLFRRSLWLMIFPVHSPARAIPSISQIPICSILG